MQVDNSVKHWRNLPITNQTPDLPSYQCMYKVWLKSLDIYSSYRLETKIWAWLGQITLSKFNEICPLASQTRSPQYQCTYQVWWESIDVYLSYHPETKIWVGLGQITPSKFDENHPLAIPNQISTISMHIPSLEKIHWCLLKDVKNGKMHVLTGSKHPPLSTH